MLFDEDYYIRINEARWAAAQRILTLLPSMSSCIDAGCGPGWFADKLVARGLRVIGVDGRPDLVEAARARVPGAMFTVADICDRHHMAILPKADLVFCFGLLYHLENPAAAVRSLVPLGKYLLIETQIAPHAGAMLQLVEEGKNETQGLAHVAIIPSRAALVRLLFEAGAGSVQRYVGPVKHDDFIDTEDKIHRREIFLVAREPVVSKDFVIEIPPPAPKLDVSRRAIVDSHPLS